MTFRPLSSQNSMTTNLGQLNDMIRDLNSREKVEIFKDDSGTRRVLLGKGATGFFGLKVSQEGFDVYTATDDQLVFNSDNNLFKIVDGGTATINVPDASNDFSGTVTVNHNLGYIPAYLAFVVPPVGYPGASNTQLPLIRFAIYDSFSAPNIAGYHIQTFADVGSLDENDISFSLFYTFGNANRIGDWTFKYYLLQESAT